jgi:hypothetical protein
LRKCVIQVKEVKEVKEMEPTTDEKISELVKKIYEPAITDDYRMERQYATIVIDLIMSAESPEK